MSSRRILYAQARGAREYGRLSNGRHRRPTETDIRIAAGCNIVHGREARMLQLLIDKGHRRS